jgi:hypothetical protein
MAHHMAKKSAAKGSHNVMARHPKATGLAAGLTVHHALEKKQHRLPAGQGKPPETVSGGFLAV